MELSRLSQLHTFYPSKCSKDVFHMVIFYLFFYEWCTTRWTVAETRLATSSVSIWISRKIVLIRLNVALLPYIITVNCHNKKYIYSLSKIFHEIWKKIQNIYIFSLFFCNFIEYFFRGYNKLWGYTGCIRKVGTPEYFKKYVL